MTIRKQMPHAIPQTHSSFYPHRKYHFQYLLDLLVNGRQFSKHEQNCLTQIDALHLFWHFIGAKLQSWKN